MIFDTIIIGGGRSGMAKAVEELKAGRSCALISKGRSIYGFDPKEFEALGGRLFNGDEAVKAELSENGKTLTVKAIFTANLEDTPLCADKFILATGKFFAGGLRADMDRVFEPVFGLDVECEQDRGKWFADDFFADQPIMHAHVATDAEGHAIKGGKTIENLFPIGEISTL